MRWILASACSSRVGFLRTVNHHLIIGTKGETYQWGSKRYAREAAVRVSLIDALVSSKTNINDGNSITRVKIAYPTAPHDSVRSITRTFASVRKRSTTRWRSLCGTLPSNRILPIETSLSPASAMSSVNRQVENTTLRLVSMVLQVVYRPSNTYHLTPSGRLLMSVTRAWILDGRAMSRLDFKPPKEGKSSSAPSLIETDALGHDGICPQLT